MYFAFSASLFEKNVKSYGPSINFLRSLTTKEDLVWRGSVLVQFFRKNVSLSFNDKAISLIQLIFYRYFLSVFECFTLQRSITSQAFHYWMIALPGENMSQPNVLGPDVDSTYLSNEKFREKKFIQEARMKAVFRRNLLVLICCFTFCSNSYFLLQKSALVQYLLEV